MRSASPSGSSFDSKSAERSAPTITSEDWPARHPSFFLTGVTQRLGLLESALEIREQTVVAGSLDLGFDAAIFVRPGIALDALVPCARFLHHLGQEPPAQLPPA